MREAAIASQRSISRNHVAKSGRKLNKSGLAAGIAVSAFLVLRRHPGQVLGVVASLLAAGTIIGNAVLFQSGRHPAPFFAHPSPNPGTDRAETLPVPVPTPRPVAAVERPVRPADPLPAERAPDKEITASKSASSVILPVHGTAAKTAPIHKPDAIGQLLRSTGTPGPEPATEAHVFAAQRALEKLGFPVKPDGRMGVATRAGLEKFQRDRHMDPADGLPPRLLRDLAAAAGLPPG